MSRFACLYLTLTATACLLAEEGTSWPALKASWAAEHLKLADEMLKAGCIGFADAQAGLAGQLAGAEDPGVKAYEEKRKKIKLPDKGWEEKDWKAYEAKRGALNRKEAQEATDLLKKGEQESSQEVETWALRLDPDQAEVRKRRGEEKCAGLGWLPAETVKNLKAGNVKFADVWEKPDLKKYVSWDKHYEIPTEHFLIKTTLPTEKARERAMILEAEYRIWEEIFEGVTPIWGRSQPPPVWLLRTTADYQACVASEAPAQVELSKDPVADGFAMSRQAFFRDDATQGSTISPLGMTVHECSHLIHYGIPPMNQGDDKGLWCVEGMATLLEPLQTAKTPDWNGVALSRTPRTLVDAMGSLDALPALFDMDQPTFYNPSVRCHYSQSYVLAHFLMYGQGGAHRRDLLCCLLTGMRKEYGGYDAHFHQMPKKELCVLAKAYALKVLQ